MDCGWSTNPNNNLTFGKVIAHIVIKNYVCTIKDLFNILLNFQVYLFGNYDVKTKNIYCFTFGSIKKNCYKVNNYWIYQHEIKKWFSKGFNVTCTKLKDYFNSKLTRYRFLAKRILV